MDEIKRKKRKRRRLIGWLIVLVILLALGGVLFSQRENLKALKVGTELSSAELEQRLQENREAIEKVVEERPDVSARVPTEEERQALREGTLSEEELVELLIGGTPETPPSPQETPPAPQEMPPAPEETPAEPQETPTEPSPSPEPDEDEAQYRLDLSRLIARVYVLRESYVKALEDMEAEGATEYENMPKKDRTKAKLVKWAADYVNRATDMERQCDRQIDEIAREMAALLRAHGDDLDLVDQVLYTYANEKSLKKSWYLSKLEERGLLS